MKRLTQIPTSRAALLRGVWLRILLFAAAPATSAETRYSVTDFGTLSGYAGSYATGINNLGHVVGASIDGSSGYTRATLFTHTSPLDLGTLGGANSTALAINDYGTVVGESTITGEQESRAFAYHAGTMRDLGTLGGPVSVANGIDNVGRIVGQSRTGGSSNTFRAFVSVGGTMNDLGTLPAFDWSFATGINDLGQVVGGAGQVPSGRQHAFLRNGGVMYDLGTLPGFVNSVATAINNRGVIVGHSSDPSLSRQAFRYESGMMTALGTLGGSESYASAVNDRGQIVGVASLAGDDVSHAFVHESGQLHDLDSLVRKPRPIEVTDATGINSRGQIAATGLVDGAPHALRLTPIQKVVLAFGNTTPFSVRSRTLLDRFTVGYTVDEGGSMPGADYSPDERRMITDAVQRLFTSSGVSNVEVVDGPPEDRATVVYFTSNTDGPAGYTIGGVDRFNRRESDKVVVFKIEPTIDAETAAHEVGHALGLRHVKPGVVVDAATGTKAWEVMHPSTDRPSGTELRFLNRTSRISDPTNILLSTHNPLYHLRRFVDGFSDEELDAQGIRGGAWDLPSSALAVRLDFGDAARTLYDVDLFVGGDVDESRVVAHFAQITLAELTRQSLAVEAGEGIALVGHSTFEGPSDVILSLPGMTTPSSLYVPIEEGEFAVNLAILGAGDTLTPLAQGGIAVGNLPEPSAAAGLLLGCLLRFGSGRPSRLRARAANDKIKR